MVLLHGFYRLWRTKTPRMVDGMITGTFILQTILSLIIAAFVWVITGNPFWGFLALIVAYLAIEEII